MKVLHLVRASLVRLLVIAEVLTMEFSDGGEEFLMGGGSGRWMSLVLDEV